MLLVAASLQYPAAEDIRPVAATQMLSDLPNVSLFRGMGHLTLVCMHVLCTCDLDPDIALTAAPDGAGNDIMASVTSIHVLVVRRGGAWWVHGHFRRFLISVICP